MDFRYALRRLARSPGFTVVAILSLALGIGANTAMFSIVNAVLLRELPVRDADRLVEIYTSDDNGFQHATSSIPDYLSVRGATADVFEGIAAYQVFIAQNNLGSAAPLVMGELVSGNFFDVLGVQPVLGRGFRPEEDASPDTHPVAVISYGYWQRVFAGATNAIGATVTLNRRPYTVVGVAPRKFIGAFPGIETQMYVPLMMAGTLMPGSINRVDDRGSRSLFVKGRLRADVTVERAAAAVTTVSKRLEAEFPESNKKRLMNLLPSSSVSIHPAVDRALVPVAALLLAVVGMVLLIACANLASFLLARAADRKKEIAIRLALGAGRGRLIRQLLIESTVLSVAGGLAGLGLAWLIVRALLGFQPPLPIPLDLSINLDTSVLAFTALISIGAGILFGLAPALQSTRPQLAMTLRDEAGQVTGTRARVALRNVLVAGQIAVSSVLLIGSGLFVRSMQKAQDIDAGFYTGPAAVLWPNMEMSGYDEARGLELQTRLRERLLQLPGVTHVTFADRLPLGASVQTRGLNVDGVEKPEGRDQLDVDFTHADPDYFKTLDVAIVAGRGFTESDRADAPRVAVVSQAAARAWWPSGNPIGQSLYLGADRANPVRVIGVARDTKVRTLGEQPRPYVYFSNRQQYIPAMQVVVRGQKSSAELLADARRATLELDPQLVLFEAKTMQQHLDIMLFAPRMAALLLSVFGGLALLLAAVGLYGLVSYAVARRTKEIGVRMALGASTRDVIRLMTGEGMKLVALGGGAGVVLAALMALPLSRFLYGIATTDVITFAAIPLLLAVVAFFACIIPAGRASRTSPLQALASE